MSLLKPQGQRTLSRTLHLIGAALVGTFVYAPRRSRPAYSR